MQEEGMGLGRSMEKMGGGGVVLQPGPDKNRIPFAISANCFYFIQGSGLVGTAFLRLHGGDYAGECWNMQAFGSQLRINL